ncbi:MAG: ATPase [Desulfobacterales bacterium C00003060]|nr:MAG: ATPase [Desulfobacterales bacterium S3730MH5]OEU79329.1 MAG: ATPase [Desulfobacterales bacterium C00003060]
MIKSRTCETITIGSTEIMLARPAELPLKWVGQKELIKQVLAAWMVIDERDVPFNPRLIGKPGVGKTTLGYAAARRLNREIYLFQATMDTRPEDLIVTPVMGADSHVKYAASSLVTAMMRGGVCILDEGNRMSERSWASLAPLLDDRRYVESIITGLTIPADPDFRFIVTINEDASTYEIPEYIHSRLQPQIFIDFPDREDELLILKENLPFADEDILNYMVDFLQRAHTADEVYSVRDGINMARYAMKMMHGTRMAKEEAMGRAILTVLGEEGLRYEE